MERKSFKEQLMSRYSKLKKRINDWENAIYKTEGRKANKDDMKAAPKEIQESYKDLVKIRKYLENGCPETPKKDIGTPGKIFLGKHRQQLGRSEHSYLTTTPVKVHHHQKAKPKPVVPTLGLRSSGNSNSSTLSFNATTTETKNAPQQFTFKKLFNLTGSGAQTATENKKAHKMVTVKEDDDKLVERPVLVPKRFSLRPNSSNTLQHNPASNSMDDSLEEDYIMENPFKNKHTDNNDSNDSCADAEGVVTKPEIKSPVVKPKMSLRTARQLNTGWLARLEEDGENNEGGAKELNNFSTSYSAESENTSGSDQGCPKSPLVEEIKDNGTNGSFSFGETSMEIDCDDSTLPPPPITFDNSDSGICVFNPEDVYQAVEEVLAETRQNDNSGISNADESLLCSYSEDACLPSDSDFLNRSDKNTISDIIKSLSDSVSGDEEANSESCSDQTDGVNLRKRKATVLFSPSPKKPVQKRKFFKSSRAERVATYSLGTYKPPSPLKKIKSVKNSKSTTKTPAVPITPSGSKNLGRSGSSKTEPQPGPSITRSKRVINSERQISYTEEDDHEEITLQPPRKSNLVVDAFDEAARPISVSIKRRVKRNPTKLDKKEQLESKIASGKMNENYVRIDTKRKVFVRDAAEDECPAEQDDSPFPSLEEAARMIWTKPSANTKRVNIYSSSDSQRSQDTGEASAKSEAAALNICSEEPTQTMCLKLVESVDPFFSDENAPVGPEQEFEDDVIQEGLKAFGYESFRPITGIPPFLNAACLHSNMSAKQKQIVLDKVKAKQLHILLVSPESVCGGLFGLLKGTGESLPIISFACIDEVHCVSQWSHNFRPSYLQLCKILREKLNVKTILGLTATATRTTARSICEHLNIDPSTTIRGELIPKNLKLSASRDVHKDEALITLLRGDRFRECDSIIIYCTRREECERIASFVRTQIQVRII
ncbi:ATP-dependent DNA helicase Q4 [Orchesella cincta]|uniref:ATP-dependent DNA helicase Q4 n=1 Tax=Orchesella cincta TaxID=48709 RepID=A0A1D2NF63_ORCCI|nr:ATP-dependent DNA helicase Q4 [Orchesella cincta]